MHELPPVDEGSEGIGYAFKKDEEVWSDHPAVPDDPAASSPSMSPGLTESSGDVLLVSGRP